MGDIQIVGAKAHNLKGIDVTIPRNSLTVVTGLSGSGKSTLAFDTLYAEGQRRYVESLSAYARQFLDRLAKPDVERIEGLSPAISIEQRTTSGNPRSIVATVTEIHDYLRILYGSVATPHCPKCGREVSRQSAEQIVDAIERLGEGLKILLLAPVVKGKKGRHEEVFATLKRNGFVRVRVDGETHLLEEVPELDKKKAHNVDVIVDRLVIPCDRTRLTDSVELALKTGGGVVMVNETTFSELNACPHCGLSFDELKPRSFSFNSPFGACPTCGGLGQLYYFDEDLVVPDRSLPLRECIHPWRRAGHNAIMYYNALLEQIAKQYKVKLSSPYEKLPASFRKGLMHGFKEDLVLPWRTVDKPFDGVLPMLQRYVDEAEDDETRAKWTPYQSYRVCPDCHGARLNEFSRAATVAGKTICEVMAMPVTEALRFFRGIGTDRGIGIDSDNIDNRISTPTDAYRHLSTSKKMAGLRDIIAEIVKRLQFLLDVGLDYLTLDRAASTLSGGEMQRIRLATQIGSGLTGVLYVLDEPTIGLPPRDNERLIATLKELRDRGNTVVIVEHDEEMMRAADWIVDLGPGAGREGGQLMYQGDFKGLLKAKSLTAEYLRGEKGVGEVAGDIDRIDRFDRIENGHIDHIDETTSNIPNLSILSTSKNRRTLTLSGAAEHNLKNITVHIPVGSFTVVTGVSGSGKSTLVDETLKPVLMNRFYGSKEKPGRHRKVTGMEHFDKVIEIDQSPIGRTPRSNPATYVGIFDDIRNLFAQLPSARMRGYKPGRFSFNVAGGRCDACKGAGVRTVEMNFLPDVYINCEVCNGKRYNRETLEIRYKGKSISDVLDMTVNEAVDFFEPYPKIFRKLRAIQDVGLGYITLGQQSTTLSGGEAQRIKLASELSKADTGNTLYILDEPTTGLHFEDIRILLGVLQKLVDKGNTVLVIEHNMDVIKVADYIIDMGPDGGAAGGKLIFSGTPEQLAQKEDSFTGVYLKEELEQCYRTPHKKAAAAKDEAASDAKPKRKRITKPASRQ